MKKTVIKVLKIILTITLLINIYAINNTKSYAQRDPQREILDDGRSGGGTSEENGGGESSTGMSDISQNPGSWEPSVSKDSSDLNDKVGIIVSLVRTIGIIVSVGSLALIGIKFMLGSAEEKAQYKQTMMPWIIGAIMVFAITFLPTLIYNFMRGSNEGGQAQTESQMQISINKTNVTLKIGENTETTLVATLPDGSVKNARWTSSNAQVATVDQNGKVKAKSKGTTTIKAFLGSSVAICNVTVDVVETTGIDISEESITLNAPIEKTHKLIATITPSYSKEPIIWTSSDTNVVKVEGGKVTAVGAGNAIVTATSGTKSASCNVQVKSSRVYTSQYYNPSTGTVSSTKTSDKDMGFWIYIPDISQVGDLDELPLILFLHGTGSWRNQY